jgi:uncharacterized protein (TIGR03086 family)
VVSADPVYGLDGASAGRPPDRDEPCLRRSARRRAPPRRRAANHIEDDPVGAYRDSAARLRAAFEQPEVLERTYRGPLGAATGAERLQIRLYDLLAHGWDLAQATGQPAELPDDVAEQSPAFVRTQLTEQAGPCRFGPAQTVDDHAPAVERLVAFLGRTVNTDP